MKLTIKLTKQGLEKAKEIVNSNRQIEREEEIWLIVGYYYILTDAKITEKINLQQLRVIEDQLTKARTIMRKKGLDTKQIDQIIINNTEVKR